MQKKLMIIIITAIAAAALIVAGWYILSVRFGIGPDFPFIQYQEIHAEGVQQGMIAEDQLLAMTDTEEEAKAIAEQYGIELKSFRDGIAVYHTEEDPFAVIARGQENGYAELSINFIRALHGEEPESENAYHWYSE